MPTQNQKAKATNNSAPKDARTPVIKKAHKSGPNEDGPNTDSDMDLETETESSTASNQRGKSARK